MVAVEIPEWMLDQDQLSGWVNALIVLVVGVALSRVVRYGVRRVLDHRIDSVVAHLVGRVLSYAVLAFTIIYSLDAVGIAIGPIIGALGIAGLALAFALQDVLENFVAGLLLQIRRPFTYGDEISSGSNEGEVVHIDSRSVTLFTPDGESVQIPASLVHKAPLINHTERGARRSEVAVGVAYGTNLDRAIRLLTEAVARTAGVLADPPSEVLVTGFGDSSIDLVARFWHGPEFSAGASVRSRVAVEIEDATRTGGIEIPYPQRVIINAQPQLDPNESQTVSTARSSRRAASSGLRT